MASNSPYDDDAISGGDNGGTGFNSWSVTTSNAGSYIGSSTTQGFGDINTNGEAFGIWSSNPGTGYFNRPFSSNLAVGYAASIKVALAYRDGGKGVNLFDSNGNFLVNFSVTSNDYYFNGSLLGWGYSQTSVFDIVAKQTSSNNVEITVTRGAETSTVNKSGVLKEFRIYTENVS